MNNFEKLQSNWKNQPGAEATEQGFKELLQGIKRVKDKQKITNVILAITAIILVFFFIYISGYENNQVILGLALMVGTLLIRMLLEVLSIKQLGKLNTLSNYNDYKNALISYYKRRKNVHFIWTPVIVLGYVVGFLILLPLFKANLSSGFYTYIIISGLVSLIVLGIFIAKQIQKEIQEIKRLQQ